MVFSIYLGNSVDQFSNTFFCLHFHNSLLKKFAILFEVVC